MGPRCWSAWPRPWLRSAVREVAASCWAFGRDAWREVKKVVWPTRKEAMQMTAYVFALRGDHVRFPLAHRQDARMGVFRPRSGLEKVNR